MDLKRQVDRDEQQSFIWGWDDESIYFQFDPLDPHEVGKRIQDYPSLHREILTLCENYFTNQGVK